MYILLANLQVVEFPLGFFVSKYRLQECIKLNEINLGIICFTLAWLCDVIVRNDTNRIFKFIKGKYVTIYNTI